jgi:hypothetical protein
METTGNFTLKLKDYKLKPKKVHSAKLEHSITLQNADSFNLDTTGISFTTTLSELAGCDLPSSSTVSSWTDSFQSLNKQLF